MSIEHSPARQRQRRHRLPRLAYTVTEWCQLTGQSRATVYRQMKAGKLKFVTLGDCDSDRRIPAEEAVRLGLVAA
jgi:excisionase family DNA binding protein